MLLSTTDIMAGKEIVETLGLVKGNSVQSRNIGRDMMAGLRNIVGGEMKEYAEMLVRSREVATQDMVEEARRLGANAVVGVRFSTSSVMDGTSEVLAYGTAVKVKE
ncbi:YbjQ family protein [Lysinibacillus xylanilyticus]|uniref:YbjQ family protein n=1 Tax=Lysinibacillus xylanilyticus TaxID=582475 RepID=UPI002B243725|nr:YbjQ family protein [Lysinibacillus xylanilyticus]MEB2298578.1 YbjQ family protein [Lysinibacillus xylanilyticus]